MIGKRPNTIRPERKFNSGWELPTEALTVFALGNWEALYNYAAQIKPGVYLCPDKTSAREVRIDNESRHFDHCWCDGTGSIRVE